MPTFYINFFKTKYIWSEKADSIEIVDNYWFGNIPYIHINKYITL